MTSEAFVQELLGPIYEFCHTLNTQPEERDILEAFEQGRLKPVAKKAAELKKHREYATATFITDHCVNIRPSTREMTTEPDAREYRPGGA